MTKDNQLEVKIYNQVRAELESSNDLNDVFDLENKKALLFKPIQTYLKKFKEKAQREDLDFEFRYGDLDEEHSNECFITYGQRLPLSRDLTFCILVIKNEENKIVFRLFIQDKEVWGSSNDTLSFKKRIFGDENFKSDYSNTEEFIQVFESMISKIIVKDFTVNGNLHLKKLALNELEFIFKLMQKFDDKKIFDFKSSNSEIKLLIKENNEKDFIIYISPLYNGKGYRLFIELYFYGDNYKKIENIDTKIEQILNDEVFKFEIYSKFYQVSLFDERIVFELVGFNDKLIPWSLTNDGLENLIVNICRIYEVFNKRNKREYNDEGSELIEHPFESKFYELFIKADEIWSNNHFDMVILNFYKALIDEAKYLQLPKYFFITDNYIHNNAKIMSSLYIPSSKRDELLSYIKESMNSYNDNKTDNSLKEYKDRQKEEYKFIDCFNLIIKYFYDGEYLSEKDEYGRYAIFYPRQYISRFLEDEKFDIFSLKKIINYKDSLN